MIPYLWVLGNDLAQLGCGYRIYASNLIIGLCHSVISISFKNILALESHIGSQCSQIDD
jgi:hypothetical protein